MPIDPMGMDPANVPSAVPSKGMGKDDFMKLLMTQLRYQDPINPMNHQEFATQLAQFSSLEQLSNIGQGIQGLKTGMSEQAKAQAIGLIGREVKATGGQVHLGATGPVGVSLPSAGPRPVKAVVIDGSGRLVREIEIPKSAENARLEWDGKDGNGTRLPAGKYAMKVFGVDTEGQSREVQGEVGGTVTGIDLAAESPVLILRTEGGASTRVDLASIASVSTGSGPEKSSASAAPAVPVDPDSVEADSDEAERGWRTDPFLAQQRMYR